MGCTAKFVDGYSAITGAHTHEAARCFRSTALCPLWWSSCCFCGLNNSCILHTATALAALMMNTFLRKVLGRLLSLLTIQYATKSPNVVSLAPSSVCFRGVQFLIEQRHPEEDSSARSCPETLQNLCYPETIWRIALEMEYNGSSTS